MLLLLDGSVFDLRFEDFELDEQVIVVIVVVTFIRVLLLLLSKEAGEVEEEEGKIAEEAATEGERRGEGEEETIKFVLAVVVVETEVIVASGEVFEADSAVT